MKLSHISTELDGMSFAHCCCPLSSVHIVLCLLNCGMFTKDEDDSTTGQLTKLKLDCYGRSSSWTMSLPLSLVPCPMHAREKVRVVYINISGPKECHHSLPNLPPSSLLLLSSLLCNWSRLGGRERRRCHLSISSSSTQVAMDHVGSWTVQHITMKCHPMYCWRGVKLGHVWLLAHRQWIYERDQVAEMGWCRVWRWSI